MQSLAHYKAPRVQPTIRTTGCRRIITPACLPGSAQMDSLNLPLQSGRPPYPKSRPRSRIYRKKQSLVQRVASTLRRRRSHLHFLYTNALLEMAESKLNLPHEGQPGLIYAVPEIPIGHNRQSLIDVFDDVVASMSASTTKSSSQRSWITCRTSHETRKGHSVDLLTGDYDTPEDFDNYLTWQPLNPRPNQRPSQTTEVTNDPAGLSWSPPQTPSRASNESLIDLDTPPSSAPPTPPNGPSSYIDELFFGGLSEALTSPPSLPSQSLASLDTALFPQPLDFKDSPYPLISSPSSANPKKTLQKRAVHGNLRLDTKHLALLQSSPSSRAAVTAAHTQKSWRIQRKPVPWTPAIDQQWLSPTTPTPTPYCLYRPAIATPQLPQLLTPAIDSLLEEMNSAIDLVMESFSPSTTPRGSPQTNPTQRVAIPPRTTSRAASTTTNVRPPPPPPITTNRSSSSFRSRLGASTLNALLATSSGWSPPAEASTWQWHRWVDRAGDPDSETEEREYSRRWRETRRRGQRKERGGEQNRVDDEINSLAQGSNDNHMPNI